MQTGLEIPEWQGLELFHTPESITDLGLCEAVIEQKKLSTFTTQETGISEQRWWRRPVAPALGNLGQERTGVLGQPESQSEF